jgi:hypothetical protein
MTDPSYNKLGTKSDRIRVTVVSVVVAEQHYEEICEKFLPSKFGINFYGWTETLIHYVALFAVFPNQLQIPDEKTGKMISIMQQGSLLISIAPLPELTEEGMSAHSHILFIENI